jgi:RNA polymerase sigma-70 factor (ECF subfamily)
LTARESAFSAFYEAHERRLRAFALRRTHDPVAADDLVAAVMEIAWTKFEEVEASSAFGWLCGVAIRVQANDARVRRRRQANLERLVAEAETRPLAARLESDSLLAEQREAIEAALDALGPDDREVLRLAVWDGLDDEELGAAFGINAAAARKRLSRARGRFRASYAAVTGMQLGGEGA